MEPEFDINKALSRLKNQGIEISSAAVTQKGEFVRSVMGFMLTNKQILELHQANELNKQGITEFVRRYEEQQKKI